MNATVDADRIFTQRGAVGIDTFDAQNLNRLPTMKAPGNYRLRASPDGRLLLGITYWRQTSLDSFDVARGVMIASQTIPGATNLAGAWLGQQYYLFGLQAGHPKLWPIDPNGGAPAPGVALTPANLQDCVETPYDMIASVGEVCDLRAIRPEIERFLRRTRRLRTRRPRYRRRHPSHPGHAFPSDGRQSRR